MDELKFKHLDGVFGIFLILSNSKNKYCCVCENKSYIVAIISRRNKPAYFPKFTLTSCFNSAFLLFKLTQMK